MTKKTEVGYKKPPTAHQWKPGQSGNPSGKKKVAGAKPKPLAEQFAGLLNEAIQITIGGKKQMVTLGEALVRKYLNDLLNAPLKEKIEGMKFLNELGVPKLLEALADQSDEWEGSFTEEDRRILAAITG